MDVCELYVSRGKNPFCPSQVDCDDNNYFYHYNDNTTWPKRFIYLCQTVSFVSVELLCTTIYAWITGIVLLASLLVLEAQLVKY